MKVTLDSTDELFMMECFALAKKGAGCVSPNPMVGAVIVRNKKVITRGFHQKFGGPHAEVNAIGAVRSSLKGATLYTNFEPCNFYGKTPPCTNLIIASGVSRVVIGMLDPNPRVSGKGVRQLRSAGIEVRTGVLEEEAKKLNEAFTKHIITGLPFVTLKIAQTLDGKIADASGKSKWITSAESRKLVHRWRSQYDAVLVGAGTVNKDNPRLTVRNVNGRNPIRIIVDGHLSVNPKMRILSPSRTRTIVFISHEAAKRRTQKVRRLLENGLEVIDLPSVSRGILSMRDIFTKLGQLGITSVLAEGGGETFSSILREKQADKLFVFTAPKIFGEGLDAFTSLKSRSSGQQIRLDRVSVQLVGTDVLMEAYLH